MNSGLGMQRTATQMHRVLGVTPEVAVAAVAVAASAGSVELSAVLWHYDVCDNEKM